MRPWTAFAAVLAACTPRGTLEVPMPETDATEETGTAPPDTTAARETGTEEETGRPRHTAGDTARGITGDTGAPPAPTGDTGATAPTADTGPAPAVFDCNTIPVQIPDPVEIPGARGYHDLAFDTEGMILGASNGSFTSIDLLKADSAGNVQPFSPNIGQMQQMVWLPNGDLAVASDVKGLTRIPANGAQITINSSIKAYGLILGPDGMLYAADQDVVYRVNPTNGDAEVLIGQNALASGDPRVIAFDLDYDTMYIGTYLGSGGRIYSVELDATYTPITAPVVFARNVGTGSYHDGIGVDICGYLYIPDFDTSSLYRVTPSGQVQLLYTAPGWFLARDYPHGLEWGTGRDGWLDHSIYVPKPYDANRVNRFDLGVPSRHWTGGVAINLP